MNKDYLNTVDEWITNYVYLVKIDRAVMLLSGRRPGSKSVMCGPGVRERADAGCACLITPNERSSL